tara:strand:- start:129 stop:263 length:135 start_codon:yes stop_codon:yes gene_type:complete
MDLKKHDRFPGACSSSPTPERIILWPLPFICTLFVASAIGKRAV